MIGNVCPAWPPFSNHTRPHEPVMYEQSKVSFLWPVEPRIASAGLMLKICKHCGSLYAEEIEGGQ